VSASRCLTALDRKEDALRFLGAAKDQAPTPTERAQIQRAYDQLRRRMSGGK
jgi:hypothetical protein